MKQDLRLYQRSGEPRTIRQEGYAVIDKKTKEIVFVGRSGKPSITHTKKRSLERVRDGQCVCKVEVLIRIAE